MDDGQTDKGTISMAFVAEALAGLREAGRDPHPLLAACGIPADQLEAPLARVTVRQYAALWHHIAETLDDEFFGMDSRRMKAGSFTLLCHAVVGADTLEQALRRALRFLRLVLDDLAGELQIEDGRAWLVLVEPGATHAPPRRAFAYGTFLLIVHGLACWLVGRRIPVTEAFFRCEQPGYAAEWQTLFSPCLAFGQARTGLGFPAEFLSLPVVQDARRMKDFLRSAPANFLVKYRNSNRLAARIRRHLRALPPASWPDTETLAQQFGLSAPTLRRHLAQDGLSCRAIMDELRKDLAISLLGDTSRSLEDIAAVLGYAERSAFHRAFRKWTGASPGAYRPTRASDGGPQRATDSSSAMRRM